jgi:alpha-beta hydrolase superfamily lysophospholipase
MSTHAGQSGWSRISGTYRLAFYRKAAHARKQSIRDVRWSLEAADPATMLLTGRFQASDYAAVPYRLWPTNKPRAIVLLLHGAFDYSGAFDNIGPIFAAHGITAFAYDQRGFGATRSRSHWCGRKRMVKDVVDAVSYLRIRYGNLPLFVVGESMGAAIAVNAVASALNPDISGLVLAAPGAMAGGLRRLFASLLVRLVAFFAPDSELLIERLSARELTAASAIRLLCDPLVLRGVRPRMAFGLLELAAAAVEAARKISVPTLTMVGSKEDFLRNECIAQLHRSLAGDKSWREFEGGPHLLLHWQERDKVLAEILAWIEIRIIGTADNGKSENPRPAGGPLFERQNSELRAVSGTLVS